MAAITESRSSSTTLVARRLAPPKRKQFQSGGLMLGILVCGCMVFSAVVMLLVALDGPEEEKTAGVFVSLLFGVPSVWGIWKLKNKIAAEKKEIERYNAEDFPGLRAHWDESWLCHKCGYVGKIDEEKA